MKFTLSWLKQHLDTGASLEDISHALTDIGLEVEDITDPGQTFAPFKVAYVESAEKHPDADKLKLCQVKTESGTLQVVCGAPNAREGMKGIFAPEGTYIPGLDVTLKKTKIRGVESNGMLVSEKEMCLSEEHDGIIEVDDKYEIGTPMAEIFGLSDPVIDIALTPNRADCAGIYGIARDLAAAGLGTLKPLQTPNIKSSGASPVSVKIEDTDGCPLFLGRTITGLKNGPSPDWLQTLLKAIGLRPISALVDITNFINIAYARPLHVYDIAKLQGDITVREAKKGEKFDALNDKSYTLQGGETAITDDSGLLGLGGIVGGVSTGCLEDTTDIFLESAYFKPERIARTGRDIGVESDARYRFERGVDPEFTHAGIDIATAMILDLCGGQAYEIVQAGDLPDWKRTIDYNPSTLKTLIGLDVEPGKQIEILSALGFEITGKNPYKIQPPSWRGDVIGKADLAEEVIRIIGFDQIPSISVRAETVAATEPAETQTLARARLARTALTTRGLHECVTWSFMSQDLAAHFGSNDNQAAASLKLSNPISSELDQMRPSILPNLIEAAAQNHDRGYANAALCEIGPVFQTTKPDGQSIIACGIRTGADAERHWSDPKANRAVDLFDAKADALAVLAACGAPAANAQITKDTREYFHPGRSGAIALGKNIIAQFGEIHPAILDDMNIKFPVVGFEVYLQNLPEPRKKSGTEKPLVKLAALQPIARDFAFIVDENLGAGELIRTIKAAEKNLITDAQIFDVYQGKGVEDGQKSLAVNVTIQPKDETLTDDQIEDISGKIIDLVAQKLGGTLRG